ncbi:transposase [Streptomyces sp. NPDC060006]|uniref:transposase n=1 Tax=unclassified Streptomyces TaxID=2593676 RepID=UPI0036AC409E
MARPGKEVRLRAGREGRTLPKHTIYRVITFTKDDKVTFLGTTLLDPEEYPAAELVALYRERWEIELAFDEIKNHLGPGGPIRSRTPEGVRAGAVGLPRRSPRDPPVRPCRSPCRPPSGRGPGLLPEVRPHHPAKRYVPARSHDGQAHPLPRRGWPRGTQPATPSPPKPELPARDQEAQPVARASDPRQTGCGRAGPTRPRRPRPAGGRADPCSSRSRPRHRPKGRDSTSQLRHQGTCNRWVAGSNRHDPYLRQDDLGPGDLRTALPSAFRPKTLEEVSRESAA